MHYKAKLRIGESENPEIVPTVSDNSAEYDSLKNDIIIRIQQSIDSGNLTNGEVIKVIQFLNKISINL